MYKQFSSISSVIPTPVSLAFPTCQPFLWGNGAIRNLYGCFSPGSGNLRVIIGKIRLFTTFVSVVIILAQCATSPRYTRGGNAVRPSNHTKNSANTYSKQSAEIPADKKIQIGVASYYGPGFQGKKTASGERFDMYAMTAAHRTLPFNTKIRVTNLNNNKSVIVRINDRGPFKKGRILDLSKGAAQKIGITETGTAKVRLEIL